MVDITAGRATWIIDGGRMWATDEAVASFDPASPVADMSQTLRVEPGWDEGRVWVDATHLKGPGGSTAAAWDWSHPRMGPEVSPSRRLMSIRTAGWTEIWCDVANAGGAKRRYTHRVFRLGHDYEVAYPSWQDVHHQLDWRSAGEHLSGYWIWKPRSPGVRMRLDLHPLDEHTPAMTPGPNHDGVPAAQIAFNDIPARAPGTVMYCSFQYPKPAAADIPDDGVVYAWQAVVTFPDNPELPPVHWTTICHRIIRGDGLDPGSQAITNPFPAGHFLRSKLPSIIPLASETDRAGAPSQQQMLDWWNSYTGQYKLRVGPYESNAPIYKVDTSTPRRPVQWWNGHASAASAPHGDGHTLVDALPYPVGAFASPNTDRVAIMWDGATEWGMWLGHARPHPCDEWGQYAPASDPGRTRGHPSGWHMWATNSGKTDNLPVSTSGRLAPGHSVSVGHISMLGTLILRDEALAAYAAYHPTNQEAWDGHISHTLYMALGDYRWDRLSWPAEGTDGKAVSPVGQLCNGQVVSIHPDLDLTGIAWGTRKFGHIVARAVQLYGMMLCDTASRTVIIGMQSGTPTKYMTGTHPYDQLCEGNPSYTLLDPLPSAFVHPATGVVTPTFRVHRIVDGEADWLALKAAAGG